MKFLQSQHTSTTCQISGLFSVTEHRHVPCSHGPIGHAQPGSAENLNISIFLDRLLEETYVPGQTPGGTYEQVELTRVHTKYASPTCDSAHIALKICDLVRELNICLLIRCDLQFTVHSLFH